MSPARLRSDPVMHAISGLPYRDWEVFVRTLSHAVVGGWDVARAPFADAFANLARAGIRPEEYPRFVEAMRNHDVSSDVANVVAPTLVMTRENAAVYTIPVVREVAAGIPNAQLVTTPGNWLMPCTGDDVTFEIARFMGHQRPEFTRGDTPNLKDLLAQATPATRDDGLSPREREVLQLIAQGKTNLEIAEELVVAPATASRHVHNILNKLGMRRRAEVAAYAALNGARQNEVPVEEPAANQA